LIEHFFASQDLRKREKDRQKKWERGRGRVRKREIGGQWESEWGGFVREGERERERARGSEGKGMEEKEGGSGRVSEGGWRGRKREREIGREGVRERG